MKSIVEQKVENFSSFIDSDKFERAAIYAHRNYLSKPYTCPNVNKSAFRAICLLKDGRIVEAGNSVLKDHTVNLKAIENQYDSPVSKVIYRPNHDLPHSIRQAQFITQIFRYFEKNAPGKYPLTVTQLERLQLMMLFCVTGRRDETGFDDTKEAKKNYYSEYRENSAKAYLKYIQREYPNLYSKEEEQQLYYDALIVEIMGAGSMPTDKKLEKYTLAIKIRKKGFPPIDRIANQNTLTWMNLAHSLDLLRIYSPTSKTEANSKKIIYRFLSETLSYLSLKKALTKENVKNCIKDVVALLQYSRNLLDISGEKTVTKVEIDNANIEKFLNTPDFNSLIDKLINTSSKDLTNNISAVSRPLADIILSQGDRYYTKNKFDSCHNKVQNGKLVCDIEAEVNSAISLLEQVQRPEFQADVILKGEEIEQKPGSAKPPKDLQDKEGPIAQSIPAPPPPLLKSTTIAKGSNSSDPILLKYKHINWMAATNTLPQEVQKHPLFSFCEALNTCKKVNSDQLAWAKASIQSLIEIDLNRDFVIEAGLAYEIDIDNGVYIENKQNPGQFITDLTKPSLFSQFRIATKPNVRGGDEKKADTLRTSEMPVGNNETEWVSYHPSISYPTSQLPREKRRDKKNTLISEFYEGLISIWDKIQLLNPEDRQACLTVFCEGIKIEGTGCANERIGESIFKITAELIKFESKEITDLQLQQMVQPFLDAFDKGNAHEVFAELVKQYGEFKFLGSSSIINNAKKEFATKLVDTGLDPLYILDENKREEYIAALLNPPPKQVTKKEILSEKPLSSNTMVSPTVKPLPEEATKITTSPEKKPFSSNKNAYSPYSKKNYSNYSTYSSYNKRNYSNYTTYTWYNKKNYSNYSTYSSYSKKNYSNYSTYSSYSKKKYSNYSTYTWYNKKNYSNYSTKSSYQPNNSYSNQGFFAKKREATKLSNTDKLTKKM